MKQTQLNVLILKRMKTSLEESKKVLLLEQIGNPISKINLLPYRQNRQQPLKAMLKNAATHKLTRTNFRVLKKTPQPEQIGRQILPISLLQ